MSELQNFAQSMAMYVIREQSCIVVISLIIENFEDLALSFLSRLEAPVTFFFTFKVILLFHFFIPFDHYTALHPFFHSISAVVG